MLEARGKLNVVLLSWEGKCWTTLSIKELRRKTCCGRCSGLGRACHAFDGTPDAGVEGNRDSGCLENDDLENEDLRPRKRRPRKRRPRKQRPRKRRPRKRRQGWGSSKD